MRTLLERIDTALDNRFKVPRSAADVSKKEFDSLGFRVRSVPLDVHSMARAVASGKKLSPAKVTKLSRLLKKVRNTNPEVRASRLNLLGGRGMSKNVKSHLRGLRKAQTVQQVGGSV